ncbi:Toll-like receptor Tollo [Gryllus bimaculatus]|nr:Toll-like receptor Tollo [Gryllus bimaculatus]
MLAREATWALGLLMPCAVALATAAGATPPPPCSADTPEQPCLLQKACNRTGPRRTLPMSEEVIDLLNDFQRCEMALSSFVNNAGVTTTADSSDLLLHPKILRSADWRISLLKAECRDSAIPNSAWNILAKKFDLIQLILQGISPQILHLSKTLITSLFLVDPLLNSSLQLTGLHLTECQLPSIQEEDIKLLSKQTKLEILDLSKNKIDYIPVNWSDLPASIKILNLSSNFLTSVQFMFFSDVKLKVIDISKNKLRVIGNLLESGRADSVNVSFNNIIEVCGVNYGRNINNLNLSHNMVEITEQSVASLSSLHSIDLGGNLFHCQVCNITILQKWVSGQHNMIKALNGTGDLFCFPKHSNLRVADVKQEECKTILYSRNPEWARVFQVSLVLSLIFLMAVLLRGYKFETCYLMRLWQNRTNKTRRISQTYEYDAFICYSNADREWVIYELMEKLEGAPHNYRICDHERDFILGSFISQNIVQSMHRSRHILFVLSETFFNSQWCLWELEMARHREFEGGGSSPILIQLTPVDQLHLSDNIEVLLDSCKSLHSPNEPFFWEKLVNMLGKSLANFCERTDSETRV